MRRLNAVCAAAILSAMATMSGAATLTPLTPGGAPCNATGVEVCPQDKSAAAFGVPMGEPVRMTVPAGTVFPEGLTYAKDGTMLVDRRARILSVDSPGEGYAYTDEEGVTRFFFKFDRCANWGPAELPTEGSYIPPAVISPDPFVSAQVVAAAWVPGADGLVWEPHLPNLPLWPSPPEGTPIPPTVDPNPWVPIIPVTPIFPGEPGEPEEPGNPGNPGNPTEPAPPIVMLPASMSLLLLGLTCLGALSGTKRRPAA